MSRSAVAAPQNDLSSALADDFGLEPVSRVGSRASRRYNVMADTPFRDCAAYPNCPQG